MPSAHATARRNLAQRIERFLRAQEIMTTPTLTGWQCDQVYVAVELLEAEQFADGERVMMYVEKAAIFEPAGYMPCRRMDGAQLLDELARALAE